MKTKFRLFVAFEMFICGVVLFWLTGFLVMFVLPFIGLVYVGFGGKIHG
ncbi:MAG: hypothetical protein PHI01_03575 [Candidatus Izemoplasmatales bacterium]|nr:hypothetical protein [Candidatus Izemoplasmatales bacterium]